MSDATLALLHLDGLKVFYNVIAVVLQSIFYGIHLLLLPFGVHTLLKRDREARPNKYVVFAIIVPFLLSSIYWALQLAELLVQIQVYFIEPARQFVPNFTHYITLFNAVILLNYLVSDAVVVWRARVLCKDEYGRLLLVPEFFLTLTTLSIVSTIGVRIASYFATFGPDAADSVPLIRAIDFFQVSNLIWSFLTNFTATFIVSFKAWRYRQVLKAGFHNAPNKTSQAEQVLTLLIESGFLYCISGATVLIFTMVKLPYGTVGDIYTPMNLQFAGMYPAVVIVLISLQRSKSNTLQWQLTDKPSKALESIKSDPTVSGQIQFARSAPLYLGSVSEEDLEVDGRVTGSLSLSP